MERKNKAAEEIRESVQTENVLTFRERKKEKRKREKRRKVMLIPIRFTGKLFSVDLLQSR